ncbi:hypothetical protein EDD52_101284 [Primorskyibacter sedentarius]|uniref:Uncharacterized protein n=1 Tax=Primorskyibacter sedentarius TaxID=745311 RepID=A0A4R3JPW6_9RHOB|nr:hypothetical protein [Primorskyibacter sedentarius]TCS67189.1 hypothetical protein EDD52_101284 [Primorskyibacter sedentarius]
MSRKRSLVVTIAVTVGQLLAGRRSDWSEDQVLVLEALRRSANDLNNADEAELAAYLSGLGPEQLRGVVSNVKGIFHELLVERAENFEGDEITARLFQETNHPGADIEFLIDGGVVCEMQLKAVQSPASIIEHFSLYPDTDVLATSEVTALLGGVFGENVTDSGFSNEEITRQTQKALDELADENLGDFIQDGIITSGLLTGALAARSALSRRMPDRAEVRSLLEAAGVGIGATITVEALLGLL